MHKKIATLVVLIFTLIFGFTACKNGFLGGKEEKYKEVARLDFPITAVKTLNPVISTDQDTYFISRLIYDGLFDLDDKLIPKNNLAADYRINKGSDSINISLISAKFHDGKPLTSSDVKFSIEAYKAAGSECLYYPLVKNIYSVKTRGDNQVKIYFNNGSHMSLDYLTFPILPEHKYDGISDVLGRKSSFKPVGTGKYQYKSSVEDKEIKLSSNEEYHGIVPKNSITFSVVQNPDTAYQLVEASSLSAIFTKDSNREKHVQRKSQVMLEFPSNEAEIIGFNMSKEGTSVKNVRKAIAYAIDNSEIIHNVYDNSAIHNDSLYYPNYLGVKTEKDPYKHSVKKAKKYLKEAGYEDWNNDGIAENSSGAHLSIEILVNGDQKKKVEEANIIKRNLKTVGAGAYVTAVPKKLYKKYLEKGNFDIFIGSMKYNGSVDLRDLLEFDKPQEVYVSDNYSYRDNKKDDGKAKSYSSRDKTSYGTDNSGNNSLMKEREKFRKEKKKRLELKVLRNMIPNNLNYGRYYNGRLNDLLDKMKSGGDIEKMKATLIKIKDLLTEEVPYYCVLQKTYGAIQAPSLNGKLKPMFDNYYFGIEQLNSKYEVKQEKKEKEEIPRR